LETVGYAAALVVTVYYYVSENPARRRAPAGVCSSGLVRIDGLVHIAFSWLDRTRLDAGENRLRAYAKRSSGWARQR